MTGPAEESAPTKLTAESPVVSHFQLLAAEEGPSDLLVDEGVSRVWMDIRQPYATDEYVLVKPDGGVLEGSELDRIASKYDMRDADLTGGWLDLVAWTPTEPGPYKIESDTTYFATVRLEGGGTLELWITPDPDGRLVPANEVLSLYAALRDAEGRPLEGAEVIATVRDLTDQPQIDKTVSLHLAPTRNAGVYVHKLESGLPEGVHSIRVSAVARDFRRDLAVSIAALDGPSLAGHAVPQFMVNKANEARAEAGATVGCVQSAAGSKEPGTWFPYQPDSSVDPGLPVLLLQHGIIADHDDWTDGTQLGDFDYTPIAPTARDEGYRIALTNLEPNGTPVDNATILNHCLRDIAEYYDVKQVVILAHSKGGVDSDVALMTYGSERAETVITLTSPHGGTELADLTVSLPVEIRLALFGQLEATFALTPAARQSFQRTMGGEHPADFRTFNAWDYQFDDTYFLGWVYKNVSGPIFLDLGHPHNDGLVSTEGSIRPAQPPVQSTEALSRVHHVTKVNHSWLKDAVRTWGHIKDQLATARYDNSPSAPDGLDAEASGSTCSIELRWIDQAKWESGFEVERSIDGEPFEVWNEVDPPTAQTTGALVTTHDESVQPGSTHRYRVRAFVENPRDDDRWYSEYEASGSINLPNTSDCQAEEVTVGFDVTVTQPLGVAPREFDAVVALTGTPPEGNSNLPVSDEVSIDQDSNGQSYTFGTELPSEWNYDVSVVVATQSSDGQPVADCDVQRGSGTIGEENVDDVLVNCVVTPNEYSIYYEYFLSTPTGHGVPNTIRADVHLLTTPPPGSPQSPIETIITLAATGRGNPSGEEGVGQHDNVPDGWGWEMSVGNVSGGTCDGGGSGTIEGQDAGGPENAAASFDCVEWEVSDCDQFPELPWCYTPAPTCLLDFRRVVSGPIVVHAELECEGPPEEWGEETCEVVQVTTVYYFYTWVSILHCGGTSIQDTEKQVAGASSSTTQHSGPLTYLRTQTETPWSGTVFVSGIARGDGTPVEGISFLVDGEPFAIERIKMNLHDVHTCGEHPSTGCDPNSGFIAELDTTRLANGAHRLQVIARSDGDFQPIGFHDIDIVVDNGGGLPPSPPPCTDSQAPEVTLNAPPSGSVLNLGELTTLEATATDGESGVERVDFFSVTHGSVLGTDYTSAAGSIYSYDWTPQHAVTYEIKANAWDNCGNLGVSQTRTIHVTDPNPPPPPGPQNCGSDNTPPDVVLQLPQHNSNASVGGSHPVKAEADDYNGIDRVEFLVNGAVVATDWEPAHPLTHIYDSTWTPSEVGTHLVKARAWDICDNYKYSFTHTVNVTSGSPPPPPPPPCPDTSPPTNVAITQPTEGSTHESGSAVTVRATAEDDIGVTRVDFHRNGLTLIGSSTTPPYEISWTPQGEGSPFLTATAYDQCNETESAPRTVNIVSTPSPPPCPDTVPPTVAISDPAEGSNHESGTSLLVRATASDDVGVTRVDFYKNFVDFIASDSTPPYEINWTPQGVGSPRLTAKAYDQCNETESAPRTINVVANPCSGDTTGPDVEITWPVEGELEIDEANEVRASATDPNGVDYIDFHIDGAVVRDHDPDWTAVWSNPQLGPAYLWARAVDTCGNPSDSDTVYVEVVEQPSPENPPEP